ncbi:MAG: hypothetical protein M1816_007621 [Peltula sp. TS41687]|nr:MAG: hypothetical protein M1816_007621 [Peltula sp. TS41687]
MSSWLSRSISSQQTQLAVTAIVSGVVVAGTIFGLQHARQRLRVEDLKRSIPDLGNEHQAEKLTDYGVASRPSIIADEEDERRSAALAARAQRGDYDEELILEQLARNRVFLNDTGLSRLRSSFIIVVGCGGVGSHATTALARSGVSKIRLIDFDQVTLSSLNRHAVATLADVGTPKVHCLRKRLEQVTPWVAFDCRNQLFGLEAAEVLLGPWAEEDQRPDYIIDAIDNIDSKVALLSYCHQHSLPVVSSMGAGCKSDPTRVFIGDISTSTEDPLSRSTRRRLRAQGIDTGIPVVYSTEKPGPGKAQLLPLPEEEFVKGQVDELGVLPDFRIRILPVLGTMPAVFGYVVANHVILAISGYPHDYITGKAREKLYDGILSHLQGIEERVAAASGYDIVGLKLPVTKEDVGYLVEEVYRGKSVVSGIPTRLALIRWRARPRTEDEGGMVEIKWGEGRQKSSRLDLSELVCMTKEEAAVHEKEILRGNMRVEDLYDGEILRRVERRMEEQRGYEVYR